ncbi:hypothetical protein [Streptomyces sp. SYSU K21746]
MPNTPPVPERSDLIFGADALIAALTLGYTCSHCRSEPPVLHTDDHGITHLHIAHDDTCPVLNGHISAAPDAIRAATNN